MAPKLSRMPRPWSQSSFHPLGGGGGGDVVPDLFFFLDTEQFLTIPTLENTCKGWTVSGARGGEWGGNRKLGGPIEFQACTNSFSPCELSREGRKYYYPFLLFLGGHTWQCQRVTLCSEVTLEGSGNDMERPRSNPGHVRTRQSPYLLCYLLRPRYPLFQTVNVQGHQTAMTWIQNDQASIGAIVQLGERSFCTQPT